MMITNNFEFTEYPDKVNTNGKKIGLLFFDSNASNKL